MYSVILMAAMTAPADATSFGWRNNCGGCGGCGGCVSTACVGTGCTGYACGGGRAFGGFLGLRRWGGCGGCVGNASCHGAGACYGYAYGGMSYGFAGCYGSCYGSYTNYFSYWQQPVDVHYGYGMPMHVVPMHAEPPVAPAKPPVKIQEPPAKPKPENIVAPANVVVHVPADAILFANGIRTSKTEVERHFTTPALESGRIYHYNFKIEVVRDGQTITQNRQAEVRAGETTIVRFEGAKEATHVAGK